MQEIMRKLGKKAQLTLGDIPGITKAIGIGIIFVAVFALILVNVRTASTNATFTGIVDNGTTALLNLSNQVPLIALIAAFVIVIGVVLFLTRERA